MTTHNDFFYTTYMKTTPEKVWQAITNPEFCKQYWGHGNFSDWQVGSKWQHKNAETNEVMVEGEVVESTPYTKLVITWLHPSDAEDSSQVVFDIEQLNDMTRLTIEHTGFKQGSIMAGKVAMGWPLVLSNLKSFLETGTAFDLWAWKKTDCSK